MSRTVLIYPNKVFAKRADQIEVPDNLSEKCDTLGKKDKQYNISFPYFIDLIKFLLNSNLTGNCYNVFEGLVACT